MSKTVIILVSALALSGCAKKSADIAASYVSPIQYQAYSCKQISAEAQRVSARAQVVVDAQNKQASNDAAATAVGAILFWPALFMIDGDSPNATEVARLKGELEALEKANIEKSCGIEFQKEAETEG